MRGIYWREVFISPGAFIGVRHLSHVGHYHSVAFIGVRYLSQWDIYWS